MKDIIRLIRPRHWIKNLLIFVPAFFDRTILQPGIFINLVLGCICFCLSSSAIYVFNDIKDAPKDRQHEIKCRRPIASGAVSETTGWKICIVMLVLAMLSLYFVRAESAFLPAVWCVLYIVINIGYSMGLKNVPIADIAILSMGFVIRVLFGASVANVHVSSWLCLTVMAFAMYMGIGKRRNELRKVGNGETRGVLKYYDSGFLDKYMTIVTAIGIVFYALWAGLVVENPYIVWTVPLVIFIVMKYEMAILGESYGDPVDVLLSDKLLMGLVLAFVVILILLMFFFTK